MRHPRNLFLLALLLPQLAYAVAAIEFLRMEDDTSARAALLKPIVISFVSRGYKNVPNWAELANALDNLIREKGYTYQNIENIAEEAAVRRGMRK